MLTNCLTASTHLSSTVSQLFEPQVQKVAVFTYRSPHFCFPWRRPCDYHVICCMDGKTIKCLPNPSQHVSTYLQHFPSYSNRKCPKSPFSRTAAHIFVSPGDTPAIITQYMLHGWKDNSMLARPLWTPWGNHAKCCMDGKRIRSLQIISLNVPI